MQKMTCAIIGCGAIGREHLGAISKLKNVIVAAVCDLSPARAEATAERFGVKKWFSNYQELIAEVQPDLVHITTPPASHFPIASDCLRRGLNVLCEKPITVTYQEFCTLKQLAIENNCMLLEDQNYRFHSSVLRMCDLVTSGKIGDIVDVQIFLSLNIYAPGSPYVDMNAPYFGSLLRGGIIGDFLTHIAYLAFIFTGPVVSLRTVWNKHNVESISDDEFRGFIRGTRATACVGFSGNAQPDGFWIRVIGTKMHAEANLFEPPRLTLRRLRSGEAALGKLIDGVVEAHDVFRGTVSGFWRKLGGVSSYDGLAELIERTYRALDDHGKPPIILEEIDQVASIVDQFCSPEYRL